MKESNGENTPTKEVLPLSGLYENWFLDYASYVILERAVPSIKDGLKPVQRRILHALNRMDDGRFNKVANIIGSTMQYHPHGDASIGDAIVNLGQKDLLLETQGNWGDIRTGDSAAAPRYIEARLSPFAKEIVFNDKTTEWQFSYDGRKKEPITFPAKFPLVLAQGIEGIAVGLSTKILPHNFCEILKGAIQILKGKKVKLYPDFPTQGKIDVSNYQDGSRGGKIKVRATIEVLDSKTLIIKDIPYGATTISLIDSIIKANEKGTIKIKQVIDNTAKDVEINVKLIPGTSPDITIDALYAFTDCELSISPNACVIVEDKPQFLTISELLDHSVQSTLALLKKELEIKQNELLEKILFGSLEKIFIENKIYQDIEECETWEAVISTIDKGLTPFKSQFYREIVEQDIVKLTEIKIKRISKYDAFHADEGLKKLENEWEVTKYNLNHLVQYAVDYYQKLLEKYGKERGRKTQITTFDSITPNVVAAVNAKLYVNRADGFVGYGLKKEEYLCECSDIDDIIAFTQSGHCVVKKNQEKTYVGKNILYAGIFKKNDSYRVYNMIYVDGKSSITYVKRFNVLSVTRDKIYSLINENKQSKVLYFSANPMGEAETVSVQLSHLSKARNKVFDFDFSTLEIKGRSAKGNILTKHAVKKIVFKTKGNTTLEGLEIWYDDLVGRLNNEGRGKWLGKLLSDNKIIVFYKDGTYELLPFQLTHHFDFNQILAVYKWEREDVFNAIHYEGKTKCFFIKRFQIETTTENKKFCFISESSRSKLHFISKGSESKMEVTFVENKQKVSQTYDCSQLIDIKGWKAMGNKFPKQKFVKITSVEKEPKEEKNKKNPNKENNHVQGSLFEGQTKENSSR